MDHYRRNFRPTVQCKYFKFGDCFNGDNCSYLHGSLCREDGRCKDEDCNKSHVKQRNPGTYLKNIRRFPYNQFRRSPNRRSRSRSRTRSRSRSSYGSPRKRSKSPSFSPRRRKRSKSPYGYQKRSISPYSGRRSPKRVSVSPYYNPLKDKILRKSRSHSFSPVPSRKKHSLSPQLLVIRKHSASPAPSKKKLASSVPSRKKHPGSPGSMRRKHSASPSNLRRKRSASSTSTNSSSSSDSSISSGVVKTLKSKSMGTSSKIDKSKKKKSASKVTNSQVQNGSFEDEKEGNSRDVLVIKQESPEDLYDNLEDELSPSNKKEVVKSVKKSLPAKITMMPTENESPSSRARTILKNLPKDFFDAPVLPESQSSDADHEAFREAFLKALSSTELNTSSSGSQQETLLPVMRHPLNAESLAKPFQDKLYGVVGTNMESNQSLWTPATERNKKETIKNQKTKSMPPPAVPQQVSNWEIDTPYVSRNKHGESSRPVASTADGKMHQPASKIKKHSVEPKKKKKKHHKPISSSSSSSSSSDEDEKTQKGKGDDDSTEVVEIGEREKEEALEKKKDILSRVWTLMGQKKKLEMQRDEIALNHKGEGKSLSALLQENSVLSTEIDKQIYIMNQMVQIINGRLGISKNETHMQDFYYQPKFFGDSELPPMFLKQYTAQNLEKSVNIFLKSDDPENKTAVSSPPTKRLKNEKSRSRSKEGKRSKSRSKSNDRKRSKSTEHKSKKHAKEKKIKKEKSPERTSAKKDKKKEVKKDTKKISVSAAKDPTKLKSVGEVEYSPSPAMKPHIKYIDQGMHWCKPCNDFLDSVHDFVDHLQSGFHIEKLKSDPKPWLPPPPKIEKDPIRPGAPVLTIPLKGMEFTHSMTAFYCSLCDLFIKSKEEAEAHSETKLHVSKYKEYLSKNPMYETTYVREKMAAYAKYSVEKERSRERASMLEDTNQEAFFCEVKKRLGADISSQNSVSFEDEQNSSFEDTQDNSEVIDQEDYGKDKNHKGIANQDESIEYFCDDVTSKTNNEENEKKERDCKLVKDNMEYKLDDQMEVSDGENVCKENIKRERSVKETKKELFFQENLGEGKVDKENKKGILYEDTVKEEEIDKEKFIEEENKKAVRLKELNKEGLVEENKKELRLDEENLKELGDKNEKLVYVGDENEKEGLEKENKMELKLGEENRVEETDYREKEMTVKDQRDERKVERYLDAMQEEVGGCDQEIKNDMEAEGNNNEITNDKLENKDRKEKRQLTPTNIMDGEVKVNKEEPINDKRRKSERKELKKSKKDDIEDEDRNVTSSIRVSSRSLSSTNVPPQKEAVEHIRDARKHRHLKKADNLSYYKEKRLSIEEEEKIKALKERIKKKETVEADDLSDEASDSNASDLESKQKKKLLSNVMIGKMPFLKNNKSSNKRKHKLESGDKPVSEAEERIRKFVSEGINLDVQDSKPTETAVENKPLPPTVPANVEYITEIQSSGEESKFVKKIGPIKDGEEQNDFSKSPPASQSLSFAKGISVPQTSFTQKNSLVTASNESTLKSTPNLKITNATSKTSSNVSKSSPVTTLPPPPPPFITMHPSSVPAHKNIVIPDLRTPPPNMHFNLSGPPSHMRPPNFPPPSLNQHMLGHNSPAPPSQHVMPHNHPPPPLNQHMIGHNPPAPLNQHMMGHNPPPPLNQHMMGHNPPPPPLNPHMIGHNPQPKLNQHMMGHNPPPPLNQNMMRTNFASPNQNTGRIDFTRPPQMMGQHNSNFSGSSQNLNMMRQNNFSENNMEQNYQMRSNQQMFGSNLSTPPPTNATPNLIDLPFLGNRKSPLLQPPPPPFNLKSQAPFSSNVNSAANKTINISDNFSKPTPQNTNSSKESNSEIGGSQLNAGGMKQQHCHPLLTREQPSNPESVPPLTKKAKSSFFENILDEVTVKSFKKTQPSEEPDSLIQEGLELLECAEESENSPNISPKPNFNWEDSI